MIIHYLKIAFRNLLKYKTQSLTGILALAFGLGCFVPALYWLRYETSYDSFYPDAEHIYRFYTTDKQTGAVNELVSGILERKLHEHFAATETSTIFFIKPNDCSADRMPHIRLRMLFSDSAFFQVFPQVFLCGDSRQPLKVLNDIVLAESVAVRLFGDVENAIGQQIKSPLLYWHPPYTVTAVIKDPPPNTNMSFDAILNFEEIQNELKSIPQIESITDTYFEPQHNANTFNSEIKTMTTEIEWPGKLQYETPVFHSILTDSWFAETFKVKMQTGEWLNETGKQDVVLNEEAVRVMRLSEPVGAVIRLPFSTREYTVVGVVKDFHTMSLRSRILPTIFINRPYPSNKLYIRAIRGQEQEAIRRIAALLPTVDATLSDVYPLPVSELYDRLNQSEQAGLKMFSLLATVCLAISLFGIYAVAVSATRRRRKEIAIRKVVGAEVVDIIRLFFREYTLQVIIAGLVALPLAYLAMSRWLQGYAYRTTIPWWLLTGVITLVVAMVLLTVLGQTMKAANQNPAEVVNSE